MAARNSPSPFKFQTLATLLYRYRVVASSSRRSHHRDLPPYKLGCVSFVDQGLSSICSTSRAYCQSNLGMEKDDQSEKTRPPLPASSKSGFYNWAKWLLGSVLTLMLPLWKNLKTMQRLEGKAEKVVVEVEVVAEVVEKVATSADAALIDVAKQLPDNSKLKEAAQAMEQVTSVVVHDAQLIENVIHKAGDVKQDLEELETMVEPIVDKIIQEEHPIAN